MGAEACVKRDLIRSARKQNLSALGRNGEENATVEYVLVVVYRTKCIPADGVTTESYMHPGSLIGLQSTGKDGSGYLDALVVRPLITRKSRKDQIPLLINDIS